MNSRKVAVDRLRELFDYEPNSGGLVWRARPGIARNDRAGKVAGHVKPNGYVVVSVDGRLFLKHRVCWALAHGVWPENYIDHIDGNPSNNSLANLRCATPAQNLQNTKQYANNKSGAKGVYLHAHGKYEAFISKDRRRVYLGLFETFDAAVSARAKAQAKLFSHGRKNVREGH
jgi:hypothetical protein